MRILSITLILILLASMPLASAVTGSIGNAKMILREDVGVEIERSILVINNNDVDLTIELEVVDIQSIVTLDESSFLLEAGDRKDAGFKIKATEEGLYDGKIIVKFVPEDGNSVALASHVILITSGYENEDPEPEPEDNDPDPEDEIDPEDNDPETEDDDDTDDEEEDEEEIPRGLIGVLKDIVDKKEIDVTGEATSEIETETNPLTGILIATSIILVGLIIATLFLIKEGDKSKGEGKSKK